MSIKGGDHAVEIALRTTNNVLAAAYALSDGIKYMASKAGSEHTKELIGPRQIIRATLIGVRRNHKACRAFLKATTTRVDHDSTE